MVDTEREPALAARHGVQLLQAGLMLAVIGLCLYLVHDLWPDLRYSMAPAAALELGRAEGADFAPQLIEGDRFVRVTGIVGNRGAVVKWGRLGALWRGELWYRQLVGSSVFLEVPAAVPADAPPLATFSDVTVEGRGRLFRDDAKFDEIAAFMQSQYGYSIPDGAVLIAVGQRPGAGAGIAVGCALLGLLALVNAVALVALLRRRWRPGSVAGA
jgi:hypothetical protein